MLGWDVEPEFISGVGDAWAEAKEDVVVMGEESPVIGLGDEFNVDESTVGDIINSQSNVAMFEVEEDQEKLKEDISVRRSYSTSFSHLILNVSGHIFLQLILSAADYFCLF